MLIHFFLEYHSLQKYCKKKQRLNALFFFFFIKKTQDSMLQMHEMQLDTMIRISPQFI